MELRVIRFSLSTLFIFLLTVTSLVAGPKREFRAVWIATVGNIDWPSKQGLSAVQQQQEFVDKLDFLQQHGFNAVVVQIRPASDAFYPSKFEPWSRYLSGKQGEAPFPYYDPLKFMVEETHKRNMEFHAWFNPFRALVSTKFNPNPANHVTKQHPEWMISYGGKAYLDPGNPATRQYVLDVIQDVVKRYDIDGVHIDDYFYPYKISGQVFNDNRSYGIFGKGMSREDWRRSNINTFVADMYKMVKREKFYVKVGISPFGIWRNKHQDPRGSETNGTSCYDDLYADVLTWIENKWLDYVAPQLYWEHGHRLAAYDVLAPWWKNVCKERDLYIGMGVYRMVNTKQSVWQGPSEILKQIGTQRRYNAEGAIMYSMSSFNKIPNALPSSLKTEPYYGNIAIPPPMPWLDNIIPAAPKVVLKAGLRGGAVLTWDNETREDLKYLVYRFDKKELPNFNNAENIIALTQRNIFVDDSPNFKNYKYYVTALDRLWNESKPSTELNY